MNETPSGRMMAEDRGDGIQGGRRSVAERARDWVRGHRRATGIGVGVGSLALIGVAVILGWALLSGQSRVGLPGASPSGTPPAEPSTEPTAAPSGSAAPSATPSDAPEPELAWPPVGTDPPSTGFFRVWAVVTVDELNVRSGPGPEHPAVGQLNAGDLVLSVYGPIADGWSEVIGDGIAGYVNGGPADDPYLLGTRTPWNAYVTGLAGVASNGSSYIAYGAEGLFDYLPLAGDTGSLMLHSDDGETWTERDGPPGRIYALAGGPTGWVASSSGHGGLAWTSFSADGLTWDATVGGGSAAASGPAGWVQVIGSSVRRSTDGRSWTEPVALGQDLFLGDFSTSEAGYVVFGQGGSLAWASTDGLTWAPIAMPEGNEYLIDMELVGDRLHMLTRDVADGRSILLRGTLTSSGSVAWDGGPPGTIGGVGYQVAGISAGPDGLLAGGWSIADLVPVAWTSEDGASWSRQDLAADALGGSVGAPPVWGTAGWVALATATDGAGAASRDGIGRPGQAIDGAAQQLWRSADGVAWVPTGDPAGYDGPLPPCPPPSEASTLVLIYLGGFGDACFGDSSLTIRGQVPVIEGLGGCCWPTPDPIWLSGPYAGAYITPAADLDLGTALGLYLPPGVDTSLLVQGSWVEVVGHFDDAAAATCSRTPLFSPPMGLEGTHSVQRDCASRFVVESVTGVEGP